jgi:hypothetical protein
VERRTALIEDNVSMLRQGIELIERMGDCLYANARPPFFKGGVGSHFRHCIDFYDSFLASLATGEVDYARRRRNPLVETSRPRAIHEIEAIIDRLRRIPPVDLQKPLEVVTEDASAAADSSAWGRSTVARELQSLLSHTVHHYAMIALALRLQEIEPPEAFGVAPSTLAYWKQLKASA